MSISYGIAMFTPERSDLSQIIRASDRRLYAMKRERKALALSHSHPAFESRLKNKN